MPVTRYLERYHQNQGMTEWISFFGKKISVAVIGGGFGDLEAVRALANADVEVTLTTERTTIAFSPFCIKLPQPLCLRQTSRGLYGPSFLISGILP